MLPLRLRDHRILIGEISCQPLIAIKNHPNGRPVRMAEIFLVLRKIPIKFLCPGMIHAIPRHGLRLFHLEMFSRIAV